MRLQAWHARGRRDSLSVRSLGGYQCTGGAHGNASHRHEPWSCKNPQEVIQREAVLRQGALGFLLKSDDR